MLWMDVVGRGALGLVGSSLCVVVSRRPSQAGSTRPVEHVMGEAAKRC